MKTLNLIKIALVAVVAFVANVTISAANPENNLIYNAEEVNGVKVPTTSYIYGIGGRDTTTKEIASVFNDLLEDSKKEKIENPYRYLGLRK